MSQDPAEAEPHSRANQACSFRYFAVCVCVALRNSRQKLRGRKYLPVFNQPFHLGELLMTFDFNVSAQSGKSARLLQRAELLSW